MGQEKAEACPQGGWGVSQPLGEVEPGSDSPDLAWRSEAHLNSCWASSPKGPGLPSRLAENGWERGATWVSRQTPHS